MNVKLAAQIGRNFTYHPPTEDQEAKFEILRGKAIDFAFQIAEFTPESREQSLAMTKLEEAMFWANAAIARNEKE